MLGRNLTCFVHPQPPASAHHWDRTVIGMEAEDPGHHQMEVLGGVKSAMSLAFLVQNYASRNLVTVAVYHTPEETLQVTVIVNNSYHLQKKII